MKRVASSRRAKGGRKSHLAPTCRRIVVVLAMATTAAFVALPAPLARAGETPRPRFDAMASADGGRATVEVPDFIILEEIVDGGGPMAQSSLSSTTSTSFASLPWPGSTVITFPGLWSASTGQPFPFAYPFHVSASDPTTPKDELKDPSGSYSLAAEATATTTAAGVQLGKAEQSTSAGTQAVTSIRVEGDTVTASAESINEAISLGDGALRIVSLRSRSVTKQQGVGQPTTETELAVHATTAGGMSLRFGPGGLVVADQGVALPIEGGLDQFNQALKPFHLSVRIIHPQQIVGGASAAVFEVQSNQPSPHPEAPGGIVRLRLGGAISAVIPGGTAPIGPESGALGVPTAPAEPAQASQSRPYGAPATAASRTPTVAPNAAPVLARPVAEKLWAHQRLDAMGFAYVALVVAATLLVAGGRWWLRMNVTSAPWMKGDTLR